MCFVWVIKRISVNQGHIEFLFLESKMATFHTRRLFALFPKLLSEVKLYHLYSNKGICLQMKDVQDQDLEAKYNF